MFTIQARNVSEALYLGVQMIKTAPLAESRAGAVHEMIGPVITTYTNPCERVLFYPERDANPFFHCLEGLWMLAGRDDVEWISYYNKRMKEYSTNGHSFHGAYGARWRNWFDKDQLVNVIYRLKNYPNDRRTVLAMWDPVHDLRSDNDYKDIPCNTHIYFKVREGRLDMTVCCRSNDMVWGAYGANAVHMSMLQEYIAAMIGVSVGYYHQMSDSFHAYVETLKKVENISPDYDPYLHLGENGGHYKPEPLVTDPQMFMFDLSCFFLDFEDELYSNSFFNGVAGPMRRAYRVWKNGDKLDGIRIAETITSLDWRKACVEWMQRRLK